MQSWSNNPTAGWWWLWAYHWGLLPHWNGPYGSKYSPDFQFHCRQLTVPFLAPPTAVTITGDTEVDLGTDLGLACESCSPYPTPIVEWLDSTDSPITTPVVQTNVNCTKATLKIPSIDKTYDRSSFKCVAENGYPPNQEEFVTVRVRGMAGICFE